MTEHKITVTKEGYRRYSNHTVYVPVPLDQRKKGINKPDDPRAVRFYGEWFLPLPLVDERVMPETRPDTDAYDHMVKGRKCMCRPCQRPQAAYWQDRWRRDRGVA